MKMRGLETKDMRSKKPYFLKIFKSHYCKSVFLIALIGVYFIIPKKIFYGYYYTLLGILFMIMTSITITCFIKSIKDKVISAEKSSASVVGILSIIFGFGALQACTVGAPVCGASIGGGIIALIFPGLAFNLIEKYSLELILISIVIQFFALYFMKCFKFIYRDVIK